MKRTGLIILVAVATIATGSLAFADGSPWLPDPETGSINISYVSQNATEFYHLNNAPNQQQVKDTLKDTLSQDTVWAEGRYGLSDEFALDFRVGGARSEYPPASGTTQESFSGLTDTNIGVTWRVVDEVVSQLPSIALRLGGIIAGNYKTGYINAIGDGGNGLELSAMVGKFFADRVALSGEFGYRDRDNDIPSDFFMNLSGGVLVMKSVGLSINYKLINALSGIDIGRRGVFSRHRFPQVEEDIHFLGGTATFSVTDTTNIGVSYGEVLDGRNTAKSKVWSVSLGYSFDTF